MVGENTNTNHGVNLQYNFVVRRSLSRWKSGCLKANTQRHI